MKLVSAVVGPYKSITAPQDVPFEDDVTVFVGQNEAGKSAVLEALYKSKPVEKDFKFDVTADYPRKDVNKYRREHPASDTVVAKLTYRIEESDARVVAEKTGIPLAAGTNFSVSHRYNNSQIISIAVDEAAAAKAVLDAAPLAAETKQTLRNCKNMSELATALNGVQLEGAGAEYRTRLQARVKAAQDAKWSSVAMYDVYQALSPLIPAFLYFGDYNRLPGKTNLADLKQRRDAKNLRESDRAVLALLRMASVELDDLLSQQGHERIIQRLEGLSNEISQHAFEYWKQNQDLDFQFDIRPDPTDPEPPFNNGQPNLYIRVWNRRHKVSVPFDQRSRGFIWFFSFLVWFDDAQQQAEAKTPVILLLDEPALSLHGLAQKDFLRYIDDLGTTNQVIYTTHSPFMVKSEALDVVRVVEDRDNQGTTVSDRLDSKDPKSIFPLQAALGYTIAQNLFIGERNLLVEGPADLLYLQNASLALEHAGRHGLDPSIVIVPVGGMDKVATFIALFSANDLNIVVCTDRGSAPDQRIQDMVANQSIRPKALLDYAMFRNGGASDSDPTDVEDLFEVSHYLKMFNNAYKAEMNGNAIGEADLEPGKRIVERIERHLKKNGNQVRPSGGFNHFLVASRSVVSGLQFKAAELDAFERLFEAVNKLLK